MQSSTKIISHLIGLAVNRCRSCPFAPTKTALERRPCRNVLLLVQEDLNVLYLCNISKDIFHILNRQTNADLNR